MLCVSHCVHVARVCKHDACVVILILSAPKPVGQTVLQAPSRGLHSACHLCRDALGDDTFVEVKASALRGKNIFNMSLPEMKFAEARGNNLHIYRVAGVGTESPSLTRLINPIQLSKMKLINLCVQM